MRFKFLDESFYIDYKSCDQILLKKTRPYTFVILDYNNLLVAIPLRTNIEHEFCLKTPKTNGGLDFSKSVIIDPKYIKRGINPKIRTDDFKFLLGKEFIIEKKLKSFIQTYKKKCNQTNNALSKMSSFKYFHKELGL